MVVKRLKLTQGKTTIVDKATFKWASQWKWYFNNGYAWSGIRRDGKTYKLCLHRLIVGVPPRGMEIDHIDGDGLNNTAINLRIVSRKENQRNRVAHRKGQLFGASQRESGRWAAVCRIEGKSAHLGTFDTPQDAHQAVILKLGTSLAQL